MTDGLNDRVESEWVDDTTAFERVKSVIQRTYEFQSVSTVAERARTSEPAARSHLQQLADVGFVETSQSHYRRCEESAVCEQARRMLSEAGADTIADRVTSMQDELRQYRDEYGTESPDDAVDIDSDRRQEWKTTRRNLHVAKVALTLHEAVADSQ